MNNILLRTSGQQLLLGFKLPMNNCLGFVESGIPFFNSKVSKKMFQFLKKIIETITKLF